MDLQFTVIDDDPVSIFIARRVVDMIFPGAEFLEFVESGKGLQYLRKLAKGTPSYHVILLDMNMPNLSGIDVAKTLSREWKNNPPENVFLYVISSSEAEKDMREVKKIPIVKKYFSKPLSVSILSEIKAEVMR